MLWGQQPAGHPCDAGPESLVPVRQHATLPLEIRSHLHFLIVILFFGRFSSVVPRHHPRGGRSIQTINVTWAAVRHLPSLPGSLRARVRKICCPFRRPNRPCYSIFTVKRGIEVSKHAVLPIFADDNFVRERIAKLEQSPCWCHSARKETPRCFSPS